MITQLLLGTAIFIVGFLVGSYLALSYARISYDAALKELELLDNPQTILERTNLIKGRFTK